MPPAAAASVAESAAPLELAAPRSAVRKVALFALATRALCFAATWAGSFFPREHYRFWSGVAETGQRWAYVPSRLLDGFGRWDTWYYLRIAAFGYLPAGKAQWAHEAAFFPLFPSLVRGVAELTGAPLYFAGLAVSWIAFALAVRALWLLFRDLLPESDAAFAAAALLAFPASMFLTAVYTESLFLLLSVTAIHAALRRRFGLAGVAAALAALTRPNGVLLMLPLGLEWLLALRRKEKLGAFWPALALPAIALGAHMLLMRQVYGDPLYFQHVQAAWSRRFAPPWVALLAFSFDPDYYAVTLGALALMWVAWKNRQALSLQAHGAASIWLPLCTGTLKSMPRFAAVDFPLFASLAELTRSRRRWRVVYVAVSLLLLAIYAFRYSKGDGIN